MTLQPTTAPGPQPQKPPNSEDRDSIRWWEDYAAADTHPAPQYLYESGDVGPDGHTVEAAQYTSQAFRDLEDERLWPTVWQMACRANDVPTPGDYVEYEIAGRSILIVRDSANAVRAFFNACRHRGACLASGSGNARAFVCPFHAWTYGLDGSLEAIPAGWDFDYLDRADFGLRPCKVELFDGWVFVNPDPEAPPLHDHLGDTLERHLLMSPSGHMWKAWHYGLPVPCNWKVIATAFFETYHVPRTHPTLNGAGGDVQTKYDLYGLHSRLIAITGIPNLIGGGDYTQSEILGINIRELGSYFLGDGFDENMVFPDVPEGMTARQFMVDIFRAFLGARGIDVAAMSDAELIDALLYFVFPNFKMFRNPAGHLAYRFRPDGTDPHSSIFEVMNLVPLPPTDPLPRDTPLVMLDASDRFANHIGNLGFLLDQDVDNCRKAQKGLRNLDTAVFARKQERNIVAFHRNVAAWVGCPEEDA